MGREENIAAQESLAANVNAGRIDAAVQSFAEDCVDHDPAPGQEPGREGLRTFFNMLTAAFPDVRIEADHMVADDEHICIAYTLSGTHRGDFRGVAPTGRKIEVRGLQIGRFEDGRIVERWGASDELGLLQQIGVHPTSG